MFKHSARAVLFLAAVAAFAQADWKAGAAKLTITPNEPIRMAGFGFRERPSEGIRQDIYVRALALQDANAKTSVLVTLDLTTVERQMADEISAQCGQRYGLTRDRLVLNVSHTHSSPLAGLVLMPLYDLTPAERDVVRRYTAGLIAKTVDVVGVAIQNLAPASLSFEQGLAGIAVNRRRVNQRSLPGPVDQDVPVLAVRDGAGKLRALVVGYACHPTTLNDYRISNDYPGYALEALEKAHPGALAMFVQGCGADANALPRSGEELCRIRGAILAAAVEQVLNGEMKPVSGPLRVAFETVDLPFHQFVSREQLQKQLESGTKMYRATARYILGTLDRDGKFPGHCSWPVQVWQFGNSLKFIALGGDVVVDYSLRFKSQYGFDNTWVAGYSNDMPAYIPSKRVLQEGGYEGGESLIFFGHAGKFSAAVEEIVAEKVDELVERAAR
ncbi:MAG: neutral/alkaline non-lysosomal ceramidase N-terminal domain-containing protein [Acidobacteriales bacterium]|nr:neutral/alkaline non-lysosomal ceramidase N-terminal domain-containing protein [Terriglobales bacterium]